MSNWLTLPHLGGDLNSDPVPAPAAAHHAPATWEAIAEVAQEVQKQHHQQQEEERLKQEQTHFDAQHVQIGAVVALDETKQQPQFETQHVPLGPPAPTEETNDPGLEQKMPGSGGSADSTYVMRIHEMLEDAEREGNTDIVSWQSHGRSFRIHKESEFVEKIMPRYFRARIDSFKRWLRAWGFQRQTEGVDRGAWYHRYFVRGVTNLCKNMTRIQMLNAMENWIPVGQVPNFYTASVTGQSWAENPMLAADGTSVAKTKDPKRLRGRLLEDVRQMLFETATNEDERKIVSWLPHGRAFKVHKNDTFVETILPRYFRSAKMTYFSDALRLWGFCRLKTKGPDRGAYFHIHFVRGDATRTRHLSRKQMKEAMKDWPGPQGEPDLYSFPPPQASFLHSVAATNPQAPLPAAAAATLPPNAEMAVRTPTDPIEFLNLPAEAAENPLLLTQASSVLDQSNSTSYAAASTNMSERQDSAATNKNPSGGETTYVMRIHELLEDSERMGFQDIVSWRVHGRAFRVHKEAEFEQKIMPLYFRAKMASFQRWLRAWGFVCLREGKDRGAWYHRYFVRGVTDLCRNMSRLEMFNSMKNWLPIDQVPDFYRSGTGEMFSEAPKKEAPITGNRKNPKRLRGTVLEDLRNMLCDAEEERSTIVTWLPHGRAFKVINKNAFVASVLPRYFRAKKFTYFSDILRIWGFVRLKKQDRGAYFHRLFVKGKPELTRNLSRKQMKESMSGWPLPSEEPDLYAIGANSLTIVSARPTNNGTPQEVPANASSVPEKAAQNEDEEPREKGQLGEMLKVAV